MDGGVGGLILRIPNQTVKEFWPKAKIGEPQPLQCFANVDHAPPRCHVEDSERSSNCEALFASCFDAGPIVHKDEIGSN